MTSYDELATKLHDGRLSAKGFQLLLYILMLAEGHPVTERRCEACGGLGGRGEGDLVHSPGAVIDDRCPTCEGRGALEDLEPPLGERVQVFTGWEQYPQYLFDDGLGKRGPLTVTRAELLDHRMMLEGHVLKLAESLESWRFEAVPGSHCSQCPASAECPLPAHLRNFAGSINSVDEARETLERAEKEEAKLRALKKEVRIFAGLHGPIRVGADEVWDFVEQESKETDWDALEAGVERAASYGEPFDLGLYRKNRTSTRFRKRKLTPEELEDNGDGLTDAERFGEEAPF